MAKKRKTPAITPERVARLYRLLSLLGPGPQTRPALLRRLKLDVRGFYRDLEKLREFGIVLTLNPEGRYSLCESLEDALSRLPFPDPGLNLHEAMQLAEGETSAHKKLREKIDAFLGKKPTRRGR